jgi:hypothetical protein
MPLPFSNAIVFMFSRKFKQHDGVILALPPCVPSQDPAQNAQPFRHNVPEETAPAYESLQIDRLNPPPYSSAVQLSQNSSEYLAPVSSTEAYLAPSPHTDNRIALIADTEDTYDYIPTNERDMPMRGQRANGKLNPRPLPELPMEPKIERAQHVQQMPPDQYLTVSKPSNEASEGRVNTRFEQVESSPSSDYLAPITSSEDYLMTTPGTDDYITPITDTDADLSPTSNTDGYLAPTLKTDGHPGSTANANGYPASTIGIHKDLAAPDTHEDLTPVDAHSPVETLQDSDGLLQTSDGDLEPVSQDYDDATSSIVKSRR